MPRLGRKARRGASTPSPRLLGRNGQPQLSTNPLNHASSDRPALPLKKPSDLRVPHLRILVGDPANRGLQLRKPGVRLLRPIGERAAMQPEVAASRPPCAASPGHELFGDLPPVPGAHSFFSRASFNSSLPSISSASMRLRRAFSFCSSLSCLA